MEPLSPWTQRLSSSELSPTVIAVWEAQEPIDVPQSTSLVIQQVPFMSPRFRSAMEKGPNGEKYWKRLELDEMSLREQVKIPVFPTDLTPSQYDEHFRDYLSDIALEQFPRNRPLWEVHIITYPTTNAAGNWILKLHHTLGDGFSLMGSIFSFLKKADNPSLPLTIPSIGPSLVPEKKSLLSNVVGCFPMVMNNVRDLCSGIMRNTLISDEATPIKSGTEGIQFLPAEISSMTFSLDQIKQIKNKLRVTVNDVICGIIYYGCRMYQEKMSEGSGKINCTSMVFMNMRTERNYTSIEEMIKPNSKAAWGNMMFFVYTPIPKLYDYSDPLDFIRETHNTLSKQKRSAASFMLSRLLDIMQRFLSVEAVVQFILKGYAHSSIAISNVVGPFEQAAFGNQPIKGMYFTAVGIPSSLVIGIMSYNGTLRLTVTAEKKFIDVPKFQACLENAFKIVLESTGKITSSN